MISDAVLREIVSPDLFLSPARPNQTLAVGRIFLGLFLLSLFKQASPQNRERFLLILLLATAILTPNNFAGRDMQHLNRGVSRVHALPTGTAGTANFDSKILRTQL
jgi:hypothetical protein